MPVSVSRRPWLTVWFSVLSQPPSSSMQSVPTPLSHRCPGGVTSQTDGGVLGVPFQDVGDQVDGAGLALAGGCQEATPKVRMDQLVALTDPHSAMEEARRQCQPCTQQNRGGAVRG